MSAGYQCLSCKWLGTDPDLHRELDKIDERCAFYTVVETCPDCGSEDLCDVVLCVDCAASGVDTEATDDDFCRECAIANDWDFDTKRDQIESVMPLLKETA